MSEIRAGTIAILGQVVERARERYQAVATRNVCGLDAIGRFALQFEYNEALDELWAAESALRDAMSPTRSPSP